MIDGRTANALARLLAHVEQLGGEVVLTKDKGRWQGQVIIGASSIPTTQRDVAFGYGTLFEAVTGLLGNLGVTPEQAFAPRGQLTVGQLGARGAIPTQPRPASQVPHRPFLQAPEATS